MASVSGSRPFPQPRSGGKMVRPRRTARAGTPYDRPGPSNSASQTQSPSWLSRFVLSPTRFIASGAGKLFSSVLDLESSPTSSSSFNSSPSSSGTDSSAAEEVGTFNDEIDNPFEGDDAVKKGLQPLVGNSQSKHVIEQLLMQEIFSREECDRLIKIIRSRVIDSPTNDDDGDKRPMDMPNRTLGSDTASPDLCSAAVMEAKKWLQGKKSGLDSNSDLGYGSPSLNLVTSPQAFEDEGSPVEVAKSYMLARPPWASPSIDHIKPLTQIGIQLFKEETPHLVTGNPTSSSKLKRDSSATGSWSIQDEIERVRSRAKELRTLTSSKIDWSALTVEYKNNVNTSAIENIEANLGEKVHNFTNSVTSPDLESEQVEFQPVAVLSDPTNIISEQNQGFGAVQKTEGSQDDCREITTSGQKDGLSDDMMAMMHGDGGLVKVNGINDTNNGINDTNGANYLLNSLEETREDADPSSELHDGNCSVFKEKVGAEDAFANGFPSSGASFYAEQVIEQNTKTSDNEPSTVASGQERTAEAVLDQETCKVLSETSLEVPDVIVNDSVAFNGDDGVGTGSQNSSSVKYEVQKDHSQPGSVSDLAATPSSIAKQKGKRITRYNRRGRSRGGVK